MLGAFHISLFLAQTPVMPIAQTFPRLTFKGAHVGVLGLLLVLLMRSLSSYGKIVKVVSLHTTPEKNCYKLSAFLAGWNGRNGSPCIFPFDVSKHTQYVWSCDNVFVP